MTSRPVTVLNMDSRLTVDEASVRRCIGRLEGSPEFAVPAGRIEVAFVDPAECSRLHVSFFGDPEITDVMTFPGDPEDAAAGSIAICPEVAARAAAEGNHLPFPEELTLYLVHAWLHLAGLDDRDSAGRAAMRASEDRLMAGLREGGFLLDAGWIPGEVSPGA